MKMVRKVNVFVFVTVVLFAMQANGFGLLDYPSEEIDGDSAINENDYWDLLSDSSSEFDERDSSVEDMTLLLGIFENLELGEDDDETVEEVDLSQYSEYSELHVTKTYRFGRRVRGDGVIAFSAKNQTWPRLQNVQTNLTYPGRGVFGKKVTFIEIQVNQTSNSGKANINRGGIGKHLITVIVEAYQTLYFNFKATFYGQ